jgi:hypothetical protein
MIWFAVVLAVTLTLVPLAAEGAAGGKNLSDRHARDDVDGVERGQP